jgi:hypothetical protein
MQYDHPYFGQLFLAGLLRIVGYPSSLHPSAAAPDDLIRSIEMLHLVPRVLMGLLAVVDTFLIYKIAEVRYNRKVAFIASVLFAVMPLSWLTRRIYLENLQLPFLLLSILFAVYYNKKNYYSSSLLLSSSISSTTKRTISSSSSTYEKSNNNKNTDTKKNNNIPLILLSGIFLGLAIFTKIPAFTMIPLVGFLIISSSSATNNKNNNQNNNNSDTGTSSSTITKRLGRNIIITNLRNLPNLKALGIWFIPVILIPLIWPAYAISIGQFDSWMDGIVLQTHRGVKPLLEWINGLSRIDPVLLIVATVGFLYAAAIKRDFMFLLWIIPFLIFFTTIGFVRFYFWILLLPLFCISAAVLIEGLSDKISKIGKNNSRKNTIIVSQKILPYAIISVVAIFGLASTIMLITTNLNSSYFQLYAFIVQHLPNNNNDKVTIVGSQWIAGFSWIPNDVFSKNHDYRRFSESTKVPTKNVLFVLDNNTKDILSKNKEISIRSLYTTSKKIATFEDINNGHYDFNKYPYTSMRENIGIGRVEIRTNY